MTHFAQVSHLSELRNAILAQGRRTGTEIVLTPPKIRSLALPAPATEEQLGQILDTLLPQVVAGIAQAREALGDRRLSVAEAAALATTIMLLVSKAVSSLPMIEGLNARTLALLMYDVLFDRFVTPLLPLYLRPFAGSIKRGAPFLLETLYRRVVRRGAGPVG